MPGLSDGDLDRAMALMVDNHNNQFQFMELEQAFIIERTYGVTLRRVGVRLDPETEQRQPGGGDFVDGDGVRYELLSSPGANVTIETSDEADAIDALLSDMDRHFSRPRVDFMIIDTRELTEQNRNTVLIRARQWRPRYSGRVGIIDQHGSIVEL